MRTYVSPLQSAEVPKDVNLVLWHGLRRRYPVVVSESIMPYVSAAVLGAFGLYRLIRSWHATLGIPTVCPSHDSARMLSYQ